MEAMRGLVQFTQEHQQELELSGLLLLFLGPLTYVAVRDLKRLYFIWARARSKAMGAKRDMDRFLSDLITWGLEDAVYKGRFTRQHVEQIYARLANKMHLSDLKHKNRNGEKLGRLQQMILKRRIRKRLEQAGVQVPARKKPNTLVRMRKRLQRQLAA